MASLVVVSLCLGLSLMRFRRLGIERRDLRVRLQASLDDNQELRKIALYDYLTGLPNRVLLEDRLQQAIASCEREGGQFVVLFLDLDCFKAVNDQFGHAAGDFLLGQIAQRLSASLRQHDTIARLGGDEFVVVAETGPSSSVHAIIDKVNRCFVAPFLVAGKRMDVGTSIGCASYPEDGSSLEQLLTRADIDMYQGKNAKRPAASMRAALPAAMGAVSGD